MYQPSIHYPEGPIKAVIFWLEMYGTNQFLCAVTQFVLDGKRSSHRASQPRFFLCRQNKLDSIISVGNKGASRNILHTGFMTSARERKKKSHAVLRLEETNKLDVIISAAGALLRADFPSLRGAHTQRIQPSCFDTAASTPPPDVY